MSSRAFTRFDGVQRREQTVAESVCDQFFYSVLSGGFQCDHPFSGEIILLYTKKRLSKSTGAVPAGKR
jgi:hypothetical protein